MTTCARAGSFAQGSSTRSLTVAALYGRGKGRSEISWLSWTHPQLDISDDPHKHSIGRMCMECSDFPLAYLITFTTYGTRLPGNEIGWVDCRYNRYGTPHLPALPRLKNKMVLALRQPPFSLDASHRPLVLAAIEEACTYRGWQLEAAHVRSKHIHCVVAAAVIPEVVVNTLKSYSSRKLNRAGRDSAVRKRWTRHGSTKYLWTAASVESAIEYVIEGQGKPMSIYRR